MENVKKFYEALKSDEALRGRAEALDAKYGGTSPDEAALTADLITFAKSEGYDFTAEELEAYANAPKHIDDDELEAVAGGASDTKACACFAGGGGKREGVTCACVFGGGGKKNPGPGLVCVMAGECWLY